MTDTQFQRTLLLFGSAGLARLRQSRVAVIGCGAVGSFAIEALARTGVGHIFLADGDTVQPSNINRQLCALHSTIGENKAQTLAARIHDICPDTRVIAYPDFIRPETLPDLLAFRPDFVIDAIDILPDKAGLICAVQQAGIPLVSSMGAALKTDPLSVRLAPLNQTSVCPLAARLRRLLKRQGADLTFPCVYSVEKPAAARDSGRQMGSLITLTGLFGLVLANTVILQLVKEPHNA